VKSDDTIIILGSGTCRFLRLLMTDDGSHGHSALVITSFKQVMHYGSFSVTLAAKTPLSPPPEARSRKLTIIDPQNSVSLFFRVFPQTTWGRASLRKALFQLRDPEK